MKKLLTNNIGLKILAVIVSFFLWLIVVSVDDPEITKSFNMIPVEISNEYFITNQGKVYEVENGTDLISVSVTAKRSVINVLSRDNFKATADLTLIENDTVPIEVKSTRLADKITNISPKTTKLMLNVENLMEKQYKIKIQTTGTLAEGCVVGDITLDKNVVKISGPESVVSEITDAGATVNIAGMASDIHTAEKITLYNANGKEVDTSKLTMSMDTANIDVEIWNSKEVPLTYGYVGIPATGYGTTGKVTSTINSVILAGKKSLIDSLDSIAIPAEAIDITDAGANYEVTIDLARYIPEGTAFALPDFDSKAVVAVEIQPLSVKNVEVPVSNITLANIPDGFSTELGGVGEVVVVEVKGLGSAFDGLNAQMITGVVDMNRIKEEEGLEKLEPGVYEGRVEFSYPEGISGGTNPIIVKIILKKEGVE